MTRKRQPARSPRDAAPREWNVRDAKAQLSKVVNGALERPQRIARRDGATVVVMSEEAYRSLLNRAEGELDMVDYFRSQPIGGAPLETPPRPSPRAAARLR
jgi:hypothetical protein